MPHETWHVVQQMQGRVQPTMQVKGVSINDDQGLEHEADVMGAKALQMRLADGVERVAHSPTTLAVHAPVMQRTLKLADDGEVHSDALKFAVKHCEKYVKLTHEDAAKITSLIEDKQPHEYDNWAHLLKSLGIGETKSSPVTVPTLTVQDTLKYLDSPPEIEVGTKLSLEKQLKGGTHPVYVVQIRERAFVLKKEPAGKSEFEGMKAMQQAGVQVPAAAQLQTDKGTYVLMEFIENLFNGMQWLDDNKLAPKQIEDAAVDLGRMHVIDVRVCNVDRLPWRGNKYTGHLFNVFYAAAVGKVIGIDTEKQNEITEKMKEDIDAEIAEIRKNPKDYAAEMFNKLSKSRAKEKPTLVAEENKTAFKNGFAQGLEKAL